MTHPFARMAAIVLLAWQALVMQAHWHAPQEFGAAAPVMAVHGTARLTTPERRPDTPADCPVCREMAHAGQYLSPGAVLFGAPTAIAPVLSLATPAILRRGGRSHSWRSRAPPAPPIS